MENLTDGQRVVNFLNDLFKFMNYTVDVELIKDEDRIEINLNSEQSSSLIGYRGEMLDSIQTLAGAVANKTNESYKRVVINCEGYREKREDILIGLAKKLAVKAIKSGRKVSLEPMNAFERRIIHSALTDFANVKTESEGVEPNRYIVIIPDKMNDNKNNRENKRSSGFSSELAKAPRKSSGFGTYLGNSLKK